MRREERGKKTEKYKRINWLFAFVEFHQVVDEFKNKERNAQGQNYVESKVCAWMMGDCAEKCLSAVDEEVGVFEVSEAQQIERDAERE